MIQLGSDVIQNHPWSQKLRHKSVAVVSNVTGVDGRLRLTIDQLAEMNQVNLSCVFSPEHGLFGVAQAGEKVGSTFQPRWKVPIYSLYGDNYKPSRAQLDGIELIIIEFQDVGLRYYTYLSTMFYIMEAASEMGIPVWVLDRPNPLNGIQVEGGLLSDGYQSFVGLHPIPVRSSLTIGELALLFNTYLSKPCTIEIVPMNGWERDMCFNQTGLIWVPPSLNIPTFETVLSYAGMCFFEGTNISEGRGTTKPFEWIGAPWIDGENVAKHWNESKIPGTIARAVKFSPAFSKYQGEVCSGVQIHITDSRRPLVDLGVQLLSIIKEMYPDQVHWIQSKDQRYFIDLLSGSDALRQTINQQLPVAALLSRWLDESKHFWKYSQGVHFY